MKYFYTLVIASFLFPILSSAELPIYKVGEGARYKLSTAQEEQSNVTIIVAASSSEKVVVEMKMTYTSGLASVKLWQQFHLQFSNGKIKLSEAFIMSDMIGKEPQKLTPEYLQGVGGMQMEKFLFGKLEEIKDQRVGIEKIKTDGTDVPVETAHLRNQQNGQTIDYWISDKLKPFGIIKLESKGSKSNQNYSMSFLSKIVNGKIKIDSSKAIPLTKKAKSILPKPSKTQSLFLK